MTPSILITGGAGYIGSHTAVALMEAGHKVVILDNLCNSDARVLDRLRRLAGNAFEFEQGDVRDAALLDRVLAQHAVNSVIHFAGLKAVGESVAQPLRYFDNNVGGTFSLLQAMERADVRHMVFSSSATVYGDPEQVPIPETAPLKATNPYGRTKLVCEDMLRDLQRADPRWKIAMLRYFNPVGAHPSGLIGEAPSGAPNNLMPYIAQVAVGQRDCLNIFGDDYPTPDGTGVRDYIHVMDLARGHLAALEQLAKRQQSITVNLGTGAGVSVKQLVETFARVTGRPIAHRYVARRAGDVAVCYADTTLARATLGWQAEHDIARMCEDAWRWQSMNPTGYTN
ncbi:UDP-glucose 4-epimerase [Variovorax sp. SRS16]|uniref:UDP-glucose 4-epimerase GalE n=1 Tax=Variovorax sp. SRS16 TaxID=282217 RepID=UPI001318E2D9|nr:UDP-glucose 4-epimerase GalE [Variovorax sp. SRS16]VTU34008.1 UDP-glucose 4-epimerase [Variovorax sp. SRS16]